MNNEELDQFIKKLGLLGFRKDSNCKGQYLLNGTSLRISGLHIGKIIVYTNNDSILQYLETDPNIALNKIIKLIKEYE